MASRYWVGGTAAWDGVANTKWALTSGGAGGQTVPTSADDVFFTNLSTGICTISTGNTGAKSINCTGHTGTITGTAAITVAGSVTFVTGQTMTYTGTLTLSATGTLTTGGKTLGPITISTAGTVVTLGSALTSSGSITLLAGTLTTSASNYAVTATQLIMSGAGVKVVTLNASTVTLNGVVVNAFDYSGSNLTLNAGTSTINISGTGSALNATTGLTFNNVSFTNTAILVAYDTKITGANTFSQLTLTAPAVAGVLYYTVAANQTITTFIAAGASVIRRIFLASSVIGTARTLTVTTYTTKTDIDFQDITVAGASSPWSGTRLGNCLGNTNITFDAAKNVYWNLTGTQNWSSTGWATTSGGTPAINNFPLAQDTVIFDNTGLAGTVTINAFWNIGTLNAIGRTNAMTLALTNSASFYGNFISGTGSAFAFSGNLNFNSRTIQTITSAGNTFGTITSSSSLTTITISDALNLTTLNILGASFNAQSYNVTTSTFAGITGTINIGTAVWSITGTGTCWNVSSATIIGSAEIILSNNSTTARTFAGGSRTYPKLTIGGATGISTTTINGANTFSEIASTKTVAHTIVFPNSTTIVGAWSVSGSAGNLVTLSRTGASGTFILTKSGGGVVSANYLSISNSSATPTLTWYAGTTSTDGGGNTGWIFTNAPSAGGGGNFLMLFM